MGHPQPQSPVLPHQAQHQDITTFDLTPPFGASLHATMSGARVQFNAAQRAAVLAWLESLPRQFELATMMQEELVECPDCHGKQRMNGEQPILCLTCLGMGKVTKNKANAYISRAALHGGGQAVPAVQGGTQDARTAMLSMPPAYPQQVVRSQDLLGPTPVDTYPASHATIPAPPVTELDCEPPEMMQQ